jgi:hypothetical protein
MAGTLLLVNPRRRARHHAKRRHNPRRRHARRRNIMAGMPPWAGKVHFNPKRRARRRNPMHAFKRRHHHHRRHNPVSMRGAMAMLQQAAIASAGAIALDYLFGYVNGMLPAGLKRTPGSIGAGDAVKVVFNVALGSMIPGRMGRFARQAAEGSMTVHFYQLISQSLPTTIQAGLAGNLGWYQPAPVTDGTQWVTPNRGRMRRAAPLLSIFSAGSPALSMVPTVASPFNVPHVVGAQAGVPIR